MSLPQLSSNLSVCNAKIIIHSKAELASVRYSKNQVSVKHSTLLVIDSETSEIGKSPENYF